ncbi:M56 family metallopeptidase [Pontibacter ramchanderi]|uniref:Outer membrane transport energization protein TonB n=1 Tax=Pontibacter ramchanderi TaxID=1179743 RepID=A0A2N3U8V6_9BACT|nr:M56 family metallopeptidase [Pontibacter ramchanderi]PKV63189.1 outer membrane transport energization protein TonB [Pontibacter ramchanderi]
METTVNYLLQSALVLLVLYVFYRVVLHNQPGLLYNRLYLLLAPLVALIIPLLELPLPFQTVLPTPNVIPAIQLQEVQVTAFGPSSAEAAPLLSLREMLLLLYGAVGLVLLVRLGIQVARIRSLASAASPLPAPDSAATVLQTEGQAPSFAFLHYVFLGDMRHLSPQEQQQILSHEIAHVRLRHTYDVLYYEVLTAVLWFNPLVWLMKEELRNVHEFQADAEVLANCQPQEYSSLLAKEALFMAGIPVGSYFQKPQVFRRLRMLQLHGQPTSKMRLLLALPVILLLLVTFSANTVSADVSAFVEEPASLKEILITAPARKAGIPVREQERPGISQEPLAAPAKETAPVVKKDIKMVEPAAKSAPLNEEPADEKPYTYVENMPEFKGGEAEMMKFMGRNIRYPKDAQEAGTEGLVVLSFVVDKEGQLQDIAIVKSLHESLDKEALRVVEKMNGQWTPGSQNGRTVPVRYTLPVRFSIK